MRGVIIGDLRLSYSKLEDFSTCPRLYYLKHLANEGDGVEKEENAYAQYGSFCHKIIDSWAKKEAKPSELLKMYKDGYHKEVVKEFPKFSPSAGQEYYMGGVDYFSRFKEVIPNAEIIESEKKYVLTIFGHTFSAILDMIVKMPDGKIALVDHKSSSKKNFVGKKLKAKLKQLYIYAKVYFLIYGKYPDLLIFNLFRDGELIVRDFVEEEFNEAMKWGQEIVDDIVYMTKKFPKKEKEWPTTPQFFYCRNLCDVKGDCI